MYLRKNDSFSSLLFSDLKVTILLLVICCFSCDKSLINPPTIPSTNSGNNKIIFEGDFMAAAHPTSGKVQIIEKANGSRNLVFTNFMTDSGPDLRIYLAENDNAKNFIQISKVVKNGNWVYELPAASNPEIQSFVLIWCKLFSVNFGTAELSKI